MPPRTIEIREDLWLRLVQSAEYHGYGSPQEYAAAILEKELGAASGVTDQEVTRKMEELGYLDFGRDI